MSTNWSLVWSLMRKWKLPMSNSKDNIIIQRALRRQVDYLRIEVKQQKQINSLLKKRILRQDELLSSLSRRIETDGKLIEDFVRGNVTVPDPDPDPDSDSDSNLFLDSDSYSHSNSEVDSILLQQDTVEKIPTILHLDVDDPSLTFEHEELEKSILNLTVDTETEMEIETEMESETPQVQKLKKFKRQIPVKSGQSTSFINEKKARVHS